MKVFYYYLLIINVIALILYGIDKLKAKFHHQRISEMVLLNLSVFGGVYGALTGMYLFHHKTRKKLFKVVNFTCLIIYTFLIYYVWRFK